ncbi:MAG: fibronectin type III domain-containing protein, partial [Flavobacteriaceae bacterium]
MKKITLFTLLLFAFCWQTNAQIYIEESLDSGIPTGWTQSSYFSSTNSNYLCEGTGNLADNMYGSSANDGTITSKNHVGISNGTDTSVTFEWLARPYTTNAVDFIIYVEYSTDNGSSWTSMPQFAVNTTTPCTTYSETILAANLPSGSDFKFQIRGEWQSGDSYFYLDNILISQTITCHQPSNLTATNITTTQANLGWTENGTASLYNVEVLATGTTPTGTATDTGVANGFTKTGLTSNTNYEYYVQADCTGGDLSAWVGPFAFKTLCDPVSTFPWSEGFENITVGQPDCWGIAGTTTTASYHFYSY